MRSASNAAPRASLACGRNAFLWNVLTPAVMRGLPAVGSSGKEGDSCNQKRHNAH